MRDIKITKLMVYKFDSTYLQDVNLLKEVLAKIKGCPSEKLLVTISAVNEIAELLKEFTEYPSDYINQSYITSKIFSKYMPLLKNDEEQRNVFLELYSSIQSLLISGPPYPIQKQRNIILQEERIATSILQKYLIESGVNSEIISTEGIDVSECISGSDTISVISSELSKNEYLQQMFSNYDVLIC